MLFGSLLRMMSNLRPKGCVPRVDYRKLANPSLNISTLKSYKTTGVKCCKGMSQNSVQLFRLQIVDKDAGNELVKVHCIGYDSRFNEWQTKSDVINLNDENRLEENELRDNPSNNTKVGLVFTGPLGGMLYIYDF